MCTRVKLACRRKFVVLQQKCHLIDLWHFQLRDGHHILEFSCVSTEKSIFRSELLAGHGIWLLRTIQCGKVPFNNAWTALLCMSSKYSANASQRNCEYKAAHAVQVIDRLLALSKHLRIPIVTCEGALLYIVGILVCPMVNIVVIQNTIFGKGCHSHCRHMNP